MVTRRKKVHRATPGKNIGGRPVLSDEERRDTLVRVLTNAPEYKELQDAAAYVGIPLSTWMRVVGLERARALAAEKEAARQRNEL
jgi:hypothetical protein